MIDRKRWALSSRTVTSHSRRFKYHLLMVEIFHETTLIPISAYPRRVEASAK